VSRPDARGRAVEIRAFGTLARGRDVVIVTYYIVFRSRRSSTVDSFTFFFLTAARAHGAAASRAGAPAARGAAVRSRAPASRRSDGGRRARPGLHRFRYVLIRRVSSSHIVRRCSIEASRVMRLKTSLNVAPRAPTRYPRIGKGNRPGYAHTPSQIAHDCNMIVPAAALHSSTTLCLRRRLSITCLSRPLRYTRTRITLSDLSVTSVRGL
jgi:hypothetical protein